MSGVDEAVQDLSEPDSGFGLDWFVDVFVDVSLFVAPKKVRHH